MTFPLTVHTDQIGLGVVAVEVHSGRVLHEEWEDALPAMEMLADVERLRTAMGDVESFVQELVGAAGPAGKKVAVAKLRPKLSR